MNVNLASLWNDLPSAVREEAVASARSRIPLPDRWPAAEARKPWPRPLLSAYARYWRDGNRTGYEDPARDLRVQASVAVLAAGGGRDEDLDEAGDGLSLLCEQSTWCWAAHERFATASGTVVPDVTRPFVDLGAGETAGLLAWADLILGPALDRRIPGLRERLRYEVRTRFLDPFLSSREWHWLGLDGHLHNWNPWIHGHVLAAALFLVPSLEAVDLAVDGLSRYLDAQPADGGCDEGVAYWWNGPARLIEALQLLDRVTLGALNPWQLPPLAEMARYPMRVDLGGGWAVNVGDGSARLPPGKPWHVLRRFGAVAGLPEVAAHAAGHAGEVAPEEGLGRMLAGLVPDDPLDGTTSAGSPGPASPAGRLATTSPALLGGQRAQHTGTTTSAASSTGGGRTHLDRSGGSLPERSWLPDVQLLVCRSAGGLALAVKGGHNDENHNHLDVGSYLVAVDGVPVLIDLGQPTYTALSFTERRYEQWVTRTEWHNLPVIDGGEQGVGAGFRAAGVRVDGDAMTLDLTGAYPARTSWKRAARLDRSREAVVIRDEFAVGASVKIHHVLSGEPLAHGPGELVTRFGESVARLSWDPRHGAGLLERHEITDPLLTGVWGRAVHRLIITPAGGDFELTIGRGADA